MKKILFTIATIAAVYKPVPTRAPASTDPPLPYPLLSESAFLAAFENEREKEKEIMRMNIFK